jgi:hypothetical protein
VELVVLSRFVGDLRYKGASILIISPSVYLLCHPVLNSKVHSQDIGVGLYAKSEHFVRRPRGVAQSHLERTVPAPEFQLAINSIEIDLHKSRYEKLPSEKCPRTEMLRGPSINPRQNTRLLTVYPPTGPPAHEIRAQATTPVVYSTDRNLPNE